MKHKNRLGLDIAVPFVILAFVFGVMLWQKYQEAYNPPETPPARHISSPQKVVLLFGNSDGMLAPEGREVEGCSDRTTCLRSTLEELLSGPIGDLAVVFPEWTTINSVEISGETATLDLGSDFVEGMLPGSSAEMLAVFGIVNTITFNFEEIKQVKINIDGNTKARLKHLDLSEPLLPDSSLVTVISEVPKDNK